MSFRHSRRDFLRSVGASGAMLPLLGAGRASAATFPKRLVILAWSAGIRRGDFWPVLGPSGSETDWRLCMPGEGPKVAPFNFPVLEPVVSKFRDDMILISALDMNAFWEGAGRPGYAKTPSRGAGAHDAQPVVLTGAFFDQYRDFYETAGGPSVDQVIGKAIAAKTNIPFPSLVVGGRQDSGYNNTISYAGKGDEGITPETSPNNLFKRLFAGRSLPGGMIDTTLAARKSVLDYLDGSLTRFSKRMGAEDKAKIDAHATAIRELERELNAGNAASCTSPAAPPTDFKAADKFPDLMKAQLDLITVALSCDLTRVVSFMFESTGGDQLTFPWLGQEFKDPSGDGPGGYAVRHHHEIAHAEYHGGEWGRRHSLVNRWMWEQVAYFVGKLKATPEGSGTMLDNTAVVVLNTMGRNHEVQGLPAVIFGSCGGYFKTGGRLIRYGDYKTGQYAYFWGDSDQSDQGGGGRTARTGIYHNRLLCSLANAMDVPMATFGEPQYGGELSELKA